MEADSVESTWSSREGPILAAILHAMEASDDPRQAAKSAVPDLSDRIYQQTLLALYQGEYIDAIVQTTASGASTVILTTILPNGRRAVGQWPGDDLSLEFVRTLDRLEKTETDQPTKSRLQTIRDAVSDSGKDIFARVITEFLKTASGRI